MAKRADKYFKVDPWKIVEEGFDEQYAKVAESVFSLGNEYMGVRGYFEEGYSGETLQGSYFNGIYERESLEKSGYKGIVDETEFMVNAVNWLAVKITAEGETLDLHTCDICNFRRELDLRSGLLTRSFVWNLKCGKKLALTFLRLLSMERPKLGGQRILVKTLDFDGTLELEMESDFGTIHQMHGKNYWQEVEADIQGTVEGTAGANQWIGISGRTINTEKSIFSGSYITCDGSYRAESCCAEKKAGIHYTLFPENGRQIAVTRLVCNDRDGSMDAQSMLEKESFEGLLRENERWWSHVWEKSDIVIRGDEENQQGIRYCIFQMMQTYHGAREGNNIGAKGLTGEAYNGNAFWDTETYCLPFFLFNNEKAAKNLLLFRYQTLDAAKERAKALDCRGAFYPIATISGKECCNLWQHASLQLQASTAVAYGIWLYEKVTDDYEFLRDYGVRMLVEISRMLADRGDWSSDGMSYGYYCVMGPDEFQMMVNHNCYTNLMGKFTFQYTKEVLEKLKKENGAVYEKLADELELSEAELLDWQEKAAHIKILYDEERCLFEQHDGFFNLPHVEVDEIPVEEFPLYSHWSYDRIYRNDMIKQPDVLMFMLLFNHAFTEEQLRANYEYYEPKCIHESSLSPSVHSILAAQLKKKKEAFDFFRFATRMDLDNYNRNTEEGLHTTSIAAAWMNIVYGFGGMRSDGKQLSFAPTIPENWEGYCFHVSTGQGIITVEVDQNNVRIRLEKEAELLVEIYGKTYRLGETAITIEIPEEWR